MGCMCTQTRPQFILSSESFWGMESEPMLAPREKSPLPEKFSSEEDRTHAAASCRTASLTHYQLSYSGPIYQLTKFERNQVMNCLNTCQCKSFLIYSVHQQLFPLNTQIPVLGTIKTIYLNCSNTPSKFTLVS